MKTTDQQTETQKGKQPNMQGKNDNPRVKTVTPNDNGNPGPPDKKDTSNKGKGPKGENL